MALFSVRESGKGKIYGVYDVIVTLRDDGLGSDIRFLIWNGLNWEVVLAYNNYVPEELEYFGEDEKDGERRL